MTSGLAPHAQAYGFSPATGAESEDYEPSRSDSIEPYRPPSIYLNVRYGEPGDTTPQQSEDETSGDTGSFYARNGYDQHDMHAQHGSSQCDCDDFSSTYEQDHDSEDGRAHSADASHSDRDTPEDDQQQEALDYDGTIASFSDLYTDPGSQINDTFTPHLEGTQQLEWPEESLDNDDVEEPLDSSIDDLPALQPFESANDKRKREIREAISRNPSRPWEAMNMSESDDWEMYNLEPDFRPRRSESEIATAQEEKRLRDIRDRADSWWSEQCGRGQYENMCEEIVEAYDEMKRRNEEMGVVAARPGNEKALGDLRMSLWGTRERLCPLNLEEESGGDEDEDDEEEGSDSESSESPSWVNFGLPPPPPLASNHQELESKDIDFTDYTYFIAGNEDSPIDHCKHPCAESLQACPDCSTFIQIWEDDEGDMWEVPIDLFGAPMEQDSLVDYSEREHPACLCAELRPSEHARCGTKRYVTYDDQGNLGFELDTPSDFSSCGGLYELREEWVEFESTPSSVSGAEDLPTFDRTRFVSYEDDPFEYPSRSEFASCGGMYHLHEQWVDEDGAVWRVPAGMPTASEARDQVEFEQVQRQLVQGDRMYGKRPPLTAAMVRYNRHRLCNPMGENSMVSHEHNGEPEFDSDGGSSYYGYCDGRCKGWYPSPDSYVSVGDRPPLQVAGEAPVRPPHLSKRQIGTRTQAWLDAQQAIDWHYAVAHYGSEYETSNIESENVATPRPHHPEHWPVLETIA